MRPVYAVARMFRNTSETELERNLQRLDERRQRLIRITPEGKPSVETDKIADIFEVFNEIGIAHQRYLDVVNQNIAREIYGLLGVAGTLTLMYYRSRAQDAPQVLDPFIADKTNKEALLEPKVLMGRLDSLERNLSAQIAQNSSQSSSALADSAEPQPLPPFKHLLTAEMLACCAASLTVGVAAGLLCAQT